MLGGLGTAHPLSVWLRGSRRPAGAGPTPRCGPWSGALRCQPPAALASSPVGGSSVAEWGSAVVTAKPPEWRRLAFIPWEEIRLYTGVQRNTLLCLFSLNNCSNQVLPSLLQMRKLVQPEVAAWEQGPRLRFLITSTASGTEALMLAEIVK